MTPRRRILRTLIVCLLFSIVIEGAAALAVTISPDSIGSGGTVTVDISDLPAGSSFTLRTEPEITPDGLNSFVFDMTGVTMPFTLTDPDIRVRAEPVERAGVRVQTGSTAKSLEALGQNGIVDLAVGYNAISAPLDLVRVSGEAMAEVETVDLTAEISGEASGVGNGAITFGIAGIGEGSVQVSVLVDGSEVATQNIVVGSTAPPTIEANKESVVYDNNFVVTMVGEPATVYSLYVNDAGLASEEQYPLIAPGQPGVLPGTGVLADEAADFPYTKANLTTNAAGTRTVQFNTSFTTEIRSFTITVVDPADPSVSDAVSVAVTRGDVSVTASGTGVYYIGEEFTLSGTNTDNATTYLFLTGPDLPENGVKLDDITVPVVDGEGSTFAQAGVESDATWEYRWNTSAVRQVVDVDSSAYTIYAVSAPRDKAHVGEVKYATTSVVVKRDSITVTLSADFVARGDSLTISGTISAFPENVSVWLFGEGYRSFARPAGGADNGSFANVITGSETLNMTPGWCSVVIQHPGTDGIPDVVPVNETWIRDAAGSEIDLGAMERMEASVAFLNAIHRSRSDAYVCSSFLVVESLTDPRATPTLIPTDTDGFAGAGETAVLSVTGGAAVASVTVNLSGLGGSVAAPMTGLGNGTWTANVTAIAPSPFVDGAYIPVLLAVNATDANGIGNTSVSIPLTVVKNGDANLDNRVTLYDAVYTARHVLGIEGYPMTESVGMVAAGETLTLADAMYLARHVLGMPGYEVLH
ncbi:hypothetical protein [Methanoculleus taiwanensis]|uniref:hypothetical protein n=1 Tax=Methanoculleus taiwanensis TaxID=1550565 RepID=UPI000FFE37D3|nr:hypothetical protein [Methanoculleus taiwanensis]